MMRHVVCQSSELPDGTLKSVEVAGRALVLVRKGRQVFALRDTCPHQGAKLSGGLLTSGRLSVGVGDYRLEKAKEIVRCPWHNWEFDATSGRCLHDPQHMRVATYPAEIEGGQVIVVVRS